jgi:hypothetical protein
MSRHAKDMAVGKDIYSRGEEITWAYRNSYGNYKIKSLPVVVNGNSKILLGPILYPTGPRENDSDTVL